MAVVQTSAGRIGFAPAATTLRALRQVRSTLSAVCDRRDRRRATRQLRSMSDAQLRDIGVSRTEIDSLLRGVDVTHRHRGSGRHD